MCQGEQRDESNERVFEAVDSFMMPWLENVKKGRPLKRLC
jgi:hypothetical protein